MAKAALVQTYKASKLDLLKNVKKIKSNINLYFFTYKRTIFFPAKTCTYLFVT